MGGWEGCWLASAVPTYLSTQFVIEWGSLRPFRWCLLTCPRLCSLRVGPHAFQCAVVNRCEARCERVFIIYGCHRLHTRGVLLSLRSCLIEVFFRMVWSKAPRERSIVKTLLFFCVSLCPASRTWPTCPCQPLRSSM